jgi:hypothetical protein
MTRHTQSLALAAGVLLLTACGSSSSKTSSADSQSASLGATTDDSTPSSASSGSGTDSGAETNAADVDVCALLSQTDANEVARAHGLDGSQTAATTYTLTATKQADTGIDPTSSCTFTIADEGAEGTVAFQVQPAAHFSVYATGTKVDGLGDEAYDDGSSTVVRVGDLMISAGEDSFQDDFTTDLLRKMVPKLK